MHANLHHLDLKLLLLFDALYRHRSVVAAANELSISPSACSHALGRLREYFGDELFVRRDGGMHPSSHAEQLAPAVTDALQMLSGLLENVLDFSPSTSTQIFTFSATDFTAFALLPEVASKLEREAPGTRVRVLPSRHRDALADLTESGAQFVLGFSDEFSAVQNGVEELEGATEDYVVIARRGHPRIDQTLTLSQYLAERHVVVRPWGQENSVIDSALSKLGHQRNVAVELPSVMAAPFIVANSELLMTLPRRAAHQLNGAAPIDSYEVPFNAPTYTMKIYFLRRHLETRWHQWMRGLLIKG